MIRLKFGPLALTAVILSGFLLRTSANTITQWSFENDSVAVNNNPAPSTGAGTASSIGMDVYPTPNVGVTTDDVLVGKASDTGANGVANFTNTWRSQLRPGTNGAANGALVERWRQSAPRGPYFAASTVGYTRDQRQLRLVRNHAGRGQSATGIHR